LKVQAIEPPGTVVGGVADKEATPNDGNRKRNLPRVETREVGEPGMEWMTRYRMGQLLDLQLTGKYLDEIRNQVLNGKPDTVLRFVYFDFFVEDVPKSA